MVGSNSFHLVSVEVGKTGKGWGSAWKCNLWLESTGLNLSTECNGEEKVESTLPASIYKRDSLLRHSL